MKRGLRNRETWIEEQRNVDPGTKNKKQKRGLRNMDQRTEKHDLGTEKRGLRNSETWIKEQRNVD